MKIVVLGLSITSSWGNGHATTYRALLRELAHSGHDILFLERNRPWYAHNRDLPHSSFCDVQIYRSLPELKRRFVGDISRADCVIIGSYVPEGVAIGEWIIRHADGVTAFYDIDTPVTLASLARERVEYISRELIPKFDLYLSFTGGPTLGRIERVYGAQRVYPLYCSVDSTIYFPEDCPKKWALGYLGTFSADRQPTLQKLLGEVAEQLPNDTFVVAGSQYPRSTRWPHNTTCITHLKPSAHRDFYNAQRFTLNITRAEMVRAGYSPSVRLFEAAACATPIITDEWPGLAEFFLPGRDILTAQTATDVIRLLRELPESEAGAIGQRARERVLAEHTAAHRAAELEEAIESVRRAESFASTHSAELEEAAP